jgi:N-acyl-L-homoserine lactone synthetase
VTALDELARRLLAGSAPLRVEPASPGAELEAVLRLRYEHVVAARWASPGELRGGLEGDEYDDRAVHVAAWDGDALVGTVRLVPPVAGLRLPVEDAFDIDVEPRGAVVEIGRLVIAAGRRGDPAHRAWGGLFARAWLEVRARGYQVLAGAASAGLVARFQRLGLPFEILGPSREHWGEQRHPVRLDPAGAQPRWFGDV